MSFAARVQGFACWRWCCRVGELGTRWGRIGGVMGRFALWLSVNLGLLTFVPSSIEMVKGNAL